MCAETLDIHETTKESMGIDLERIEKDGILTKEELIYMIKKRDKGDYIEKDSSGNEKSLIFKMQEIFIKLLHNMLMNGFEIKSNEDKDFLEEYLYEFPKNNGNIIGRFVTIDPSDKNMHKLGFMENPTNSSNKVALKNGIDFDKLSKDSQESIWKTDGIKPFWRAVIRYFEGEKDSMELQELKAAIKEKKESK